MVDLIRPTQTHGPRPQTYESFSEWRQHVVDLGLLPVIGVTGSRGKTTVVRLLDAIFREAGLRTAARTADYVTIEGRKQRGEIRPWGDAIAAVREHRLDIAIEEIDWLTLNTIGIERSTRPLMAITNICGNREACLIQGDARRALAALPILFGSVHQEGAIVVNGDDMDVSRRPSIRSLATIQVGLNCESPGLRAQLVAGGAAAWLEDGQLTIRGGERRIAVGTVDRMPFTLFGRAGFQVHNALTAAALAIAIGTAPATIERALEGLTPGVPVTSDGFQVYDLDGVSVVIDRPNPSWFLRSILRAIRDVGSARIITVAGRLAGVPHSDVAEVGRLLGRASSLVVAHSEAEDVGRSDAVRQGMTMNHVPPVMLHMKSEGRALSRALSIARPGDLVLVLADRPAILANTLRRAVARPA